MMADAATIVHTAAGSSIKDGVWTGVIIAAIGVLTLILRQVGPWRKQTTDASDALIRTLTDRVDKLEKALVLERKAFAHERAVHEAERSLDRHRVNNAVQCLDAMFLMFEAAPDRAVEVIARVRDMRAKQMEAEAVEKSNIHASVIAATAEMATEEEQS